MMRHQLDALQKAEAEAKPLIPAVDAMAPPAPPVVVALTLTPQPMSRPTIVDGDDLKALLRSHAKRGDLLLEVLDEKFDEAAFARWCERAKAELGR